jgi:hypothetical protein
MSISVWNANHLDTWWMANRTFIMEFLGRKMRNMGGKRFLYLGLRTLNVYEFWTVEWWNNSKYCNAIRLYAFYLSTTLKSKDFISTIRGVYTRLSDATRQHLRTPDCSYWKEFHSFRYLCVTNLKPLTNQIIHWNHHVNTPCFGFPLFKSFSEGRSGAKTPLTNLLPQFLTNNILLYYITVFNFRQVWLNIRQAHINFRQGEHQL